jgi:hypothetical protein
MLVAVVAMLWCANAFAGVEYHVYSKPDFSGALSVVHNPAIPLAPATPNRMTPAEVQAYEQNKLARNPLTTPNSNGTMGPVSLMAKPVGGATFTSEGYGPPEPPHPFWGTNTLVKGGNLAYGTSNRPVSVDSDTSGYFYALVDSNSTSGYSMRLMMSTDQGQTWFWRWGMNPGAMAPYSKVVIVNKDSLFCYAFFVNTAGAAVVFRLNNSDNSAQVYTLRADSSVAISACWDLDRVAPWFHVAIQRSDNTIQYVRGTSQGTIWSTPSSFLFSCHNSDIAVGNVGGTSSNLFVSAIWATDSSAWCAYDSAGTWTAQKVGGDVNRKDVETAVAATHGTSGDSIRVWVTFTHYNANVYPMIYYSYNRYGGRGSWVTNQGLPGGSNITRSYWGSSINIPNWEFGGLTNGASFVNLSWYGDSVGIYELRQNWIWNGWANPAGWATSTIVNQYDHSTSALSYAQGVHRSGAIDPANSAVVYPGMGPTNAYFNGWWYTGVEEGTAKVAPQAGFELASARPNPFSRSTSIAFSLPKSGSVDLAVYDISGRKVATLAQGTMSAGSHDVSWNGAKAPAGVYLYRLSFEGKTLTNRMVVVR